MSGADHPVSEPAPWRGFRDRQDDGEFPYQSCTACLRAVFYPRVLCPHCGSTRLEWRSARGEGIVYSQTILPVRDGDDRQILLVDMAEGFRILGVSEGARVGIGDTVDGRLVRRGESPDEDPAYVFTKQET